ncbi:FUSC family protein [Pantoea agglomerans]
MSPGAKSARSSLLRQISADLAWFPGRSALTSQMAVLCSLMAMIAMMYGIPESAISCYLILFVMKPDPVKSIVMAVAVSIMVSIIVGLIILIMPWMLQCPPLRMVVLVVSSFAFLWLSSASKLGSVGTIIALVIAFAMTLPGNPPGGELVARALLYAWLMAVSPMALLIVFNMFFVRTSWKLLRATVSERLITAARVLRHPDNVSIQSVHTLLLQGQEEHLQRALLIRLFRLRPATEIMWLEAAINNSYALLLASVARVCECPEMRRHELADWCENAARAVTKNQPLEPPASTKMRTCEISSAIIALVTGEPSNEIHPPKSSFFVDDAFTSPAHQYFALKTTAASVICYLIYTALEWQNIHTAMITCYAAVLGTTGETVHKLTLRIVGCLIGALIGVLSLLFIVPGLTDIGQLMVLIFVLILPAAWVSAGNERIAYAGIQIGLAFLLTVLQGFAPPGHLDIAIDRVIGILLSNLVIYFIFTLFWPVTIADSVRARICNSLTRLATLATLSSSERAAALRETAAIEAEISRAHDALRLLVFEPLPLRASVQETAKLRAILSEIEQVCPTLYVSGTAKETDVERLRRLSAGHPPLPDSQFQALTTTERSIHPNLSRIEELMK